MIELIEPVEVEVLDAIDPAQAQLIMRNAALADLNAVNAGIQALKDTYGGKSYAVATTKGMSEAKAARLAIREPRYKVPHIVKARKAELKAIAEHIEQEGERIVNALLEIETPIDQAIKAEEDAKAAEKARIEQAAREARALIEQAIADIVNKVVEVAGQGSHIITEAIEWIDATEVTLEDFGDDAGRAEQAKRNTRARLVEMLATAEAQEANQRALIAERAALARQRQEQEAVDAAERERVAAEQKAMADKLAAQQAELDRLQAAARAQQEELDRKAQEQREAQERQEREAKEATERVERERLQRARDVQQRIDAIALLPATHGVEGSDSITLESVIRTLNDTLLTQAFFDERLGEAEQVKAKALDELRTMFTETLAFKQTRAARIAREEREAQDASERMAAEARVRDAAHDMFAALVRAERKLTAYIGVCSGDKELTDAVLPMVRAAIEKAGPQEQIAIPACAAAFGADLDHESIEQGEPA